MEYFPHSQRFPHMVVFLLVPFPFLFSYHSVVAQRSKWLQGICFILFMVTNKELNIKRVFMGLILRSQGGLSASGHCAGPSHSWRHLLHYIGSCERWEKWTQTAVSCVSHAKPPLLQAQQHHLLRLSATGLWQWSYVICPPSPQGKSKKRGCFRGKRRQTADHTKKGKILAQKNGGTRSNREKKKPSCAICKSFVVKSWNSGTQNRRWEKEIFLHLFPSF